MKIEYRLATLADRKGIAQVHVKTLQQIYRDIIPKKLLKRITAQKRMRDWKEWLSKGESKTYLALINKTIVGFISWGKSRDAGDSDHDAEIYAIYIDPDYWRSGIGKDLMQIALSEIQDKNHQSVSLWVLKNNKRARSFYKKQKFLQTSEEKSEDIVEGFPLPEIKYKKSLRVKSKNILTKKPSKKFSISPKDVLAQGKDTGEFHGVTVRKGTIKAAIENVKIFESKSATLKEKQAALTMIKKLAPDIIALELDQHVTWKNKKIQDIFDKIRRNKDR